MALAVQARRVPGWRSGVSIVGLARVFLVASIVGLWETAGHVGLIDEHFVATPSQVITTLPSVLSDPSFRSAFTTTAIEVSAAIAIAIIGGVLLGLVLGAQKTLGDIFDPFVVNLYAIPKVTLFPLFLLWLGIGINSKIAFGALHGIFPILISTAAAVRTVQSRLLVVAKAYGAGTFQIYTRVLLPAVAPAVLASARLGVIYTILGVLLGEMTAGRDGLGKLMAFYAVSALPAELYGVALITAVLTLLINGAVGLLGRRASRW